MINKKDSPVPLPGLIDLQVNGFQQIDFNHPSLQTQDVQRACRLLANEAVVGFLPTLVTNDYAQIERSIQTILAADDSIGAKILGIHLEGPFISPIDGARGAHDLKWVRKPDFDWIRRINDQTGGKIRLLTCSPEWDDSARFIESVCREGIKVAIGHTFASHRQISEAVDAGASLSTHLGNGIPTQLPRHPNPIWSQLADERLWASLIGDALHLPPEVFRTILKIKQDKAFLISDSTQFTGMKPGRYRSLIGGDVILTENSRLYMHGNENLLAGSAMSLRKMIDVIASTCSMDFNDVWKLGSIRPWQYLGYPDSPPMITTTLNTPEQPNDRKI